MDIYVDFYPRPPGGGRRIDMDTIVGYVQFLSTPSGWRATRVGLLPRLRDNYFYPRPPGGGRRLVKAQIEYTRKISIHALRVEGDIRSLSAMKNTQRFLSTPSGWRATGLWGSVTINQQISIHALRVEGDPWIQKRIYGIFISIHALRVEGDSLLV